MIFFLFPQFPPLKRRASPRKWSRHTGSSLPWISAAWIGGLLKPWPSGNSGFIQLYSGGFFHGHVNLPEATTGFCFDSKTMRKSEMGAAVFFYAQEYQVLGRLFSAILGGASIILLTTK